MAAFTEAAPVAPPLQATLVWLKAVTEGLDTVKVAELEFVKQVDTPFTAAQRYK